MKKKSIILSLLVLIPCLLFSQERKPVQLSNTQMNVNILTPSFLLEKKVTDKLSATFALGLTPIHDYNDFNEFNTQEVSINPFFRTSFRNYYPRKHVKKGIEAKFW